MYRLAKEWGCKRIVNSYGRKTREYVIDNEPCTMGVTCDEEGYPIVPGTYGNSHTHNYYFASRSHPGSPARSDIDRQNSGMRCSISG